MQRIKKVLIAEHPDFPKPFSNKRNPKSRHLGELTDLHKN